MLQQCAACTQTQSSATLRIKCFFHLFDIGKDASNGFIITDNVFRPIGFVKEFIWVEDMHYPEIADVTCMNLFQHLPYASEKAFQWIADEGEYFQYCGYMMLARLLMQGNEMNERAENELIDQALAALQSEGALVCRGASTALRRYASQCPENAKKLLKILRPLADSDKSSLKALVEDIKLEAESLH